VTTSVKMTHEGGNHAVEIRDNAGAVVATLEKLGDTHTVCIHSGQNQTFTASEKPDAAA